MVMGCGAINTPGIKPVISISGQEPVRNYVPFCHRKITILKFSYLYSGKVCCGQRMSAVFEFARHELLAPAKLIKSSTVSHPCRILPIVKSLFLPKTLSRIFPRYLYTLAGLPESHLSLDRRSCCRCGGCENFDGNSLETTAIIKVQLSLLVS